MTDSKRQSIILTGIGLVLVGGIILGFALSQPKLAITNIPNSTVYYQDIQPAQGTAESYNSAENVSPDSQAPTAEVNTYQQESYQAPAQTDNVGELAVSYPLNINTCSIQELMTISGLGEVKASAIVEYRQYLGGYTSVEQIKNIKGIGDKLFAKIAPYLTV